MKLKDITCISDLYYVIGRWFTLMMVAICFVALPFALDAWESVFSLLMCAGIAFVGVAAEYRDKHVHNIHYISALTSAVASFIWTANVCPLALFSLAFALIAFVDRKRWLLWCEVPCFLMVVVSLVSR